MGTGASTAPYTSEQEARDAGKTQEEIDSWKAKNANTMAKAPAKKENADTVAKAPAKKENADTAAKAPAKKENANTVKASPASSKRLQKVSKLISKLLSAECN